MFCKVILGPVQNFLDMFKTFWTGLKLYWTYRRRRHQFVAYEMFEKIDFICLNLSACISQALFCAYYLEVLRKKVASKFQKYLIFPIIERIRKWRSESKHCSIKITKLQENSKFTPVSSNSSLVLEGGAILENVETVSRIPELQDCQNIKDLATVN